MLAGRIDAVKNASNYDNNSVQNQRVMRPQRGPEHLRKKRQKVNAGRREIDARRFSFLPNVLGLFRVHDARPKYLG
jgi:hypothetical protein